MSSRVVEPDVTRVARPVSPTTTGRPPVPSGMASNVRPVVNVRPPTVRVTRLPVIRNRPGTVVVSRVIDSGSRIVPPDTGDDVSPPVSV